MKGIIVEVNGKKAVLLNDKGEYKIIKNQDFKVGQQIVYKKPSVMYYAACACIAAFCTVSGYGASAVPVSYVDIDINPSVRMEINLLGRVIDYTALNEDGERLLEGMGKGQVSGCVKELVARSEQLGYINESHGDMEIDVSSKLGGFYGEIEKVVDEISHADKLVNIELYKRDKGDYTSAKNYGVSMGRYKAISEYSDLSGETYEASEEKMRDKKVYEIKKQIHEMKKPKENTEPEAVEPTAEITEGFDAAADNGEIPSKQEIKPREEKSEKEDKTEKVSENREKSEEKVREEKVREEKVREEKVREEKVREEKVRPQKNEKLRESDDEDIDDDFDDLDDEDDSDDDD